MQITKLSAKDDVYKTFTDMVKNKVMQCQCGKKDKINLSRKRFINSETQKGYTFVKCKGCKVEMPLEFNFELESIKALRENFM